MKHVINGKFSFWILASFIATLMVPSLAFAQDCSLASSVSLGAVACNVSSNYGAFLDLLSGIAYVSGAIFAFKGALQLKDHTDAPQQTKLSKPLTTMVVSSSLLALPSFIQMAAETLMGGDSSQISSAFSYLMNVGAGSTPTQSTDFSSMFVAMSASLPALVTLFSLGARLMGGYMLLKCLYMLPHMEQGREAPSKIIWTFISATALWSFPILFETILSTMGTSSSAYNNNPLTSKYTLKASDGFDGSISAILMFVQMLGVIAFIRGLLILKALGENKDGAMGRALTHIFGGAAAMNITWAVSMLASTIGATGPICAISAVLCR